MQISFTDLDPSNSQDVKFMDGVTEPHPDESIHFQMGVDDEQGQNVMWIVNCEPNVVPRFSL